jgi:hypothetical protein
VSNDQDLKPLVDVENALEAVREDLFVIEAALRCEQGVDDLGALSNNAMRVRDRLAAQITKLAETRRALVQCDWEKIGPLGATAIPKPRKLARGATR